MHQNGIQPLKLQRNLKIALLKHDYDAEIIARKFLQANPNEYQASRLLLILGRKNSSILFFRSHHYLVTNCSTSLRSTK